MALALAAAVVASALAALADGGDPSPAAGSGAGRLPPGWRQIDRPITAVLYPPQVFAASTYPLRLHRRPRSCSPTAALRRMPPDGVLVQIIEYAPTASPGMPVTVPDLPPRPRRFSYADATWARFECAGPSYKFDYRQGGHALQAQVWMRRSTVDARLKRDALAILSHFQPASRREGP